MSRETFASTLSAIISRLQRWNTAVSYLDSKYDLKDIHIPLIVLGRTEGAVFSAKALLAKIRGGGDYEEIESMYAHLNDDIEDISSKTSVRNPNRAVERVVAEMHSISAAVDDLGGLLGDLE